MCEEFVAPCLTKKLENYIAIKSTRPAGPTKCVGTVRKYTQGLAGPVAIVAIQGLAGKVRFLIVYPECMQSYLAQLDKIWEYSLS